MENSSKRLCWGVALLQVALLGASPALADPGEGLNLGPAKVSPYIGANGSYDSNVLQASDDEQSTEAILLGPGATSFGLNPGFVAELKYDRFQTKFQYDHYIRSYLAEAGLRRSVSYYDNLYGKLDATIFPNGVFGLRLYERVRINSTVNQQSSSYTEILAQPDIEVGAGLFDRFYNDAGVEGRYSPGAALDFFLGTSVFYETYSLSDSIAEANASGGSTVADDSQLSRKQDVAVEGRVLWKFFPRTHFLLDAETRFINYQLPIDRSMRAWYVRSGVTGQFTKTIQAVAIIGVGGLGAPTYAGSEGTTGGERVLGQATLSWTPQQSQSLSASFIRSFGDFLVADYYVTNSLAFRYSGSFYDDLEFGASMLIDLRRVDLLDEYVSSSLTTTGDELDLRQDRRYRFRAQTAYRVAPWLRVTGSYTLSFLDSTDDALDFTQHMVMVGVRATY